MFRAASIFILSALCQPALAHGDATASAHAENQSGDFESRLFAGHGGYLHGSVTLATPLGDDREFGIGTHIVRENAQAKTAASINADYTQPLADGWHLTSYAFGYLPSEEQSAWGLGFRTRKGFQLPGNTKLTPFFGPTYARVQAENTASGEAEKIDHLLFIAGGTYEAGALRLTVFATQSFFSEDPENFESHVDLEEMAFSEAYENNDGFAKNTAGFEATYDFTGKFSVSARYALIGYEEEARHSFALFPGYQFTENFRAFAGVQILRGAGNENELVAAGFSVGF